MVDLRTITCAWCHNIEEDGYHNCLDCGDEIDYNQCHAYQGYCEECVGEGEDEE